MRLSESLAVAVGELRRRAARAGWWEGHLSSSALSTATAVCALSTFQKQTGTTPFDSLIRGGLRWLSTHHNPDGGWGDTILSLSNVSTTTLVWAALGSVPGADQEFPRMRAGAEAWLRERAGDLSRSALARTIIQRYGKDRTFSVPILTMCALSGRFGPGPQAWEEVIPLPFELAAFPASFFAALRLPVVSYALPALIAIGQARHVNAPSGNPVLRALRERVKARTLRKLGQIQPSSGGYLEATPLTSFVLMSLAGSGQCEHPVASAALGFLERSARADGSWPIDSNLATWVTTLAMNACGEIDEHGPAQQRWLLQQQHLELHPYTNAAPGGWAWTDLPGGVPDADDTAGALLALALFNPNDPVVREAGVRGARWLLGLQNRDGGIPTFCRGWGALPFDRSSPDITAHAVRAWLAWLPRLPVEDQRAVSRALDRAVRFLQSSQDADGGWIPLWFGNQYEPDDRNLVYGTARVLQALAAAASLFDLRPSLETGSAFLLRLQKPDGSFAGASGAPGSVEETALAVEAMADLVLTGVDGSDRTRSALFRGSSWLAARVGDGTWTQPAPIGFYFAKLWYYEELYPLIFTVAALRKAIEASPSA